MGRIVQTLIHLSTTGAVAAATAVALAAPAAAAPAATLTIDGDVQLTPTLRVLRIDTTGERSTSGDTTGTYRATMLDGSNPTPIVISGPVTCISVNGDDAALVYPISGVSPLPTLGGLSNALAVKISVRKATDGRPAQVGVQGPMPTADFQGCAPGPTPMMFTGTITTSG